MVKAADRAREIGASTLQVFAGNPMGWKRRAEPPADVARFRARLAELDIGSVAVHAPYLINLATPDTALWDRSVAVLAEELRMAAAYGASALNVHVGSHRGTSPEAGIQRAGQAIARALALGPQGLSDAPRLVLENSAGGGDGIGGSPEELLGVLEAAARAGADMDRVGFCLDLAHLWGAGYEVSRPEVLDALLNRCDDLLGPERLAMLHLNDSRSVLGSHGDRHEHIAAGAIGEVGFRHVLTHPRLAAVPGYLETPDMELGYDAVNMERVRCLIDGQPLPTLRKPRRRAPGGAPGKGRPVTGGTRRRYRSDAVRVGHIDAPGAIR
jgi:deoxyribonuclease-4